MTTTSTLCTSCLPWNQYYDASESSTSETLSTSKTTLSYGSATLRGYEVSDTVCLDTDGNMCLDDFEFLEITAETGLYSLDGILGLSPKNKFTAALVDNDIIKSNEYTFWLNTEGNDSSITFGGVPDDATTGKTHKHKI